MNLKKNTVIGKAEYQKIQKEIQTKTTVKLTDLSTIK